VFEGFLPSKKGRSKRLKNIGEETRSIVVYESPKRLLRLLRELKEILGEGRRVSISREISKVFQENLRGTIAEIISQLDDKKIKGEIVVIIDGK
jgi:16S rRNA (cytidine1402-2'-O)-methyltransferase